MSRIDDLIAALCPDGVKFSSIGDICTPLKKETLKTDALNVNGLYPVINSGRGWYGRYDDFNNDGNAFVVAARGEYAGFINYINERFWAGGLCYPYRCKDENFITTKFIYYVLKCGQQTIMDTLVARGSIPALNKSDLDAHKVPIPPLEVQREIVKILDAFTELEAELESELEARQKQYQYYRDELLSFDGREDVQWMKLSDVTTFINAKPHEKLVDASGDIALMTSKFVSTQGRSARFVKKEDVLTPAFIDDVALVMSDLPNGKALARAFFVDQNDRYAANQRVCLLRVKDSCEVNPRFMYYVIDRNPQLLAYDSGVDQTHLKKDWILNVDFPILPINEQVRIVDILDKFDVLVNDITYGLPAEIAARRKQYEYYRDKLLSFKEAE